MEVNQSAYCTLHSTEIALLKVKTDVIKALENQEVACLILLDLSVAFETIDHDIYSADWKPGLLLLASLLTGLGHT